MTRADLALLLAEDLFWAILDVIEGDPDAEPEPDEDDEAEAWLQPLTLAPDRVPAVRVRSPVAA